MSLVRPSFAPGVLLLLALVIPWPSSPVIAADRALDTLHNDHLRHLIQLAKDHPDQLERTLAWAAASRHLERISDHACNIAEMVVFLAEGQMLRHGGPAAT